MQKEEGEEEEGEGIEWRPLEDPAKPIFISLIYVAKRWQLQTGLIQFLPPGLLTWNNATRGEQYRVKKKVVCVCVCVYIFAPKKL